MKYVTDRLWDMRRAKTLQIHEFENTGEDSVMVNRLLYERGEIDQALSTLNFRDQEFMRLEEMNGEVKLGENTSMKMFDAIEIYLAFHYHHRTLHQLTKQYKHSYYFIKKITDLKLAI